ncbi:MAG: hypothetical protein RIE84_14650 [Parvibaculum sp.]|uniref:hypothetical protein n=1 Tax=Parvibaculum sp. TaxID=2024848 RepID=UPI0032EC43A4
MGRGYRVAAIAFGLTLAGAALAQEESKDLRPVPVDRPADQGEQTQKTPDADERAAEPVYRVRVMRDESEAVADEEKDRREEQRSEQDLDAQRSMAESADKLVEQTWWQIGIGLLGTALVLWNLILARKSNDAAVQAARAALRSATIDSEIARGRLRATNMQLADHTPFPVKQPSGEVYVKSLEDLIEDNEILLELENIGQSAASVREVRIGYSVGELPDEPIYDRWKKSYSPAMLIPMGPYSLRLFLNELSDAETAAIYRGEAKYWVYGEIEYVDIFDQKRGYRFCAKLYRGPGLTSQFFSFQGPSNYTEYPEKQEEKPSRYQRLKAAWSA